MHRGSGEPEGDRNRGESEVLMDHGKTDLYDDRLYEDFFQRQDEKPEKRKEKKRCPDKMKTVMICGGIAALLALVFLAVVRLAGLDLTQTGGLAFLLLAIVWIAYSAVTGKKNKRREDQEEDDIDQEEEAFLDALMEELYEGEGYGKEIGEKREYEQRKEELSGETRCLSGTSRRPEVRLVSKEPDKYEDIPFIKESMIIGKRRDQADILLCSDTVSRLHAKLERQDGSYYVTDLNSTNGTFLNGEQLRPNERRQIYFGDDVSFAEFRYHLP